MLLAVRAPRAADLLGQRCAVVHGQHGGALVAARLGRVRIRGRGRARIRLRGRARVRGRGRVRGRVRGMGRVRVRGRVAPAWWTRQSPVFGW